MQVSFTDDYEVGTKSICITGTTTPELVKRYLLMWGVLLT